MASLKLTDRQVLRREVEQSYALISLEHVNKGDILMISKEELFFDERVLIDQRALD